MFAGGNNKLMGRRASCYWQYFEGIGWHWVCPGQGGGVRVSNPGSELMGKSVAMQEELDPVILAQQQADLFSDPVEWVKQNPLISAAAALTLFLVLK